MAIATTILCLIPLFGLTRNTWAQQPTEAEITSQIENLKQADEFLVEDAVDALRKLGSPAIPALIKALQSENLQVRQGAVDALGRIGKPAIPALIEGLKSDSQQVRWGAANALGDIGSDAKDAVPDLREALKDKQARVRSSAADALGSISDEAKDAVPNLREALKDADARVRSSAADALGSIGTDAQDAIPDLKEALKDADARVRSSAANGLGGIGTDAKDAVPDLRKALQDSDKDVRKSAADALSRIGSDAKEAVPDLRVALKDPDKDVRSYTAYALETIGVDAKAAVPDLIVALKEDREAQVRSWAADALGRIGTKEAVPDLRIALKDDKEVQVRRSAAWALHNIGVEAKEAVSDLRAALKDTDKYVRYRAAYALGAIGAEAKEAVPDLRTALKDPDRDIRSSAAYSLGNIGPEAKEAVPDLIAALKNSDKYVRYRAAYGLGGIGAEAKEAVPDLKAALKDSDKDMRWNAIDALGKIGADAKEAIPDLKTALKDSDQDIRSSAAKALGLIAVSFQDKAKNLSSKELDQVTSDLEAALKILEADKTQFSSQSVDEFIKNLRRGINTLKEQKNAQLMNWIRQNPWVIGVIIYLILCPSLWFILLWKRPLWLLKLNEKLQYGDIELPPMLGGFKVSVRTALFLQWFHYHPKVLDAWVKKYISNARIEFGEKRAVNNHNIYIPVPIKLGEKEPTELTVEQLRANFNKNRDYLLIWGEGGSGKTNLACQIAKWAMSEDETTRLFEHLMIPVIIEENLNFEAGEGKSALLQTIRGSLDDIINDVNDEEDNISDRFLEKLLRRGRILVIVDHFSEMSAKTCNEIRPQDSKEKFTVSKLIVTSRKNEYFGGATGTIIQTQQIPGNKLYSFLETYLSKKGKALSDKAEYFEVCKQLSELVGEHRNITVLLAKLFAEQSIRVKEGKGNLDLPDNIPDLMLSYLDKLNHDFIGEKLDIGIVYRDAKIIAWECLKSSYKPLLIKRQDVLYALGGDDDQKHLDYLETRLNLIQTPDFAKDKITFAIEMIAEYLAGLHLVDIYSNNEEKWQQFLK